MPSTQANCMDLLGLQKAEDPARMCHGAGLGSFLDEG
jgi:hypothetical protein